MNERKWTKAKQSVDLAPEAQRPGLATPRRGPHDPEMVMKEHPTVAIAPQKTAARTAQWTVREHRNGTRVRRIILVKDGEAETMPPKSKTCRDGGGHSAASPGERQRAQGSTAQNRNTWSVKPASRVRRRC